MEEYYYYLFGKVYHYSENDLDFPILDDFSFECLFIAISFIIY